MSGNKSYYDDNYLPLLPSDLDSEILDLGCGQGDLTRFLSQRGYRRITAIDRDAKGISQLADLQGVTAKQEQLSPSAIPSCPGGWKLIFAKQMIYYFDRREAPMLVRALREALAPDGRLVIEIFNGALQSGRFTELKDPDILTAYTELGLKRLLEWNGFVVESLAGGRLRHRGLRGAVYAIAQVVWFKIYRLILTLERGRDEELPTIASKSIIAVARLP